LLYNVFQPKLLIKIDLLNLNKNNYFSKLIMTFEEDFKKICYIFEEDGLVKKKDVILILNEMEIKLMDDEIVLINDFMTSDEIIEIIKNNVKRYFIDDIASYLQTLRTFKNGLINIGEILFICENFGLCFSQDKIDELLRIFILNDEMVQIDYLLK